MAAPRYQWRNLTEDERLEFLRDRAIKGRPWHSPPHRASHGPRRYHITAACYQHAPILGHSMQRMDAFAADLVAALAESASATFAWCVLPNHYHILVEVMNLDALVKTLGRLHGRSSYCWNQEDSCRGRSVFFRAADRAMRSEGHFWATLNYVHHNPVHHGYVSRWTDWPWSSAGEYLEQCGRDEAARRWSAFPVLDYGRRWDDPEL